jgi:8-oxo-dGTP pyrophosphatase MutT (NUDIX family)
MATVDESQSIAFYNGRPGIRMGGGVLIFNKAGDVLLVKPTYRNTWAWPSGGWDEGESPLTVARRECEEEIGICPAHLRPAFVNYVPPRNDGSLDFVHFVFVADSVDDDFLASLKLPDDEIEAVKFVPIAEIAQYMKPYRVTALQTYLAHKIDGAMLYLEDGKIVL